MAGLTDQARWWSSTRLVVWCSLVLGLLYLGQLVLHVTSTSATVDEPVHMLAGYRHVTCGDYAFNPEHPPLVKQVAALPLLSLAIKAPQLPCTAGFTSHARRADALAAEARYDEALLDSGKAMSLSPDDPRVRISHANVLLRRGDYTQAAEQVRVAQAQVEQEPDLYGFVRPRLESMLGSLDATP